MTTARPAPCHSQISWQVPARSSAHLLSVVGDRREDGAQRLDPHGDVQEVGSEEEVIVVSQEGHHHVPAQIQERLGMKGTGSGNMEGCPRARTEA